MARRNMRNFPECVDDHKNCYFNIEGRCTLLESENKNCSFFITPTQRRNKIRQHQHLLKERGII